MKLGREIAPLASYRPCRNGDTPMKNIFRVSALVVLAFAIPARADTKIKIDTVPATYTPENYNRSERVRISSYHFEVNPQRNRTRLVVIYTYRDQITYGAEDSKGGPPFTTVEIPGLTYDANAHAIVYDADGAKAVCATVHEKGTRHLEIKNTGSCIVTAVLADHPDAWDNDKHSALDTYFNVQ
jgi:hypothetical protein